VSLSDHEKRSSFAEEPRILTDPNELASAEARNALRQYDCGVKMIQEALERQPFRLRPSMILSLQREALLGISSYAGNYRPGDVRIEKSIHTPPPAHLVASLVEDMCEYVNENWNESPIHLGAFVMWKLNWIHPFADGNGRTSRMVSYVVLSIKAGYLLPGVPTIPSYIEENRRPYFDALDDADAALKTRGVIDVGMMEKLLSRLLAKQLAAFHQSVGGDITLPEK
jgi:Fic family protein